MTSGGGQVGGPRHYEGPTLGALTSWKCPACGVENTGDLADGCSVCGSGSAKPRHVGIPPKTSARQIVIEQRLTSAEAAFDRWFRTRVTDPDAASSRDLRDLLRAAWTAGIEWYRQETAPITGGEIPADQTVRDTVPVPIDLVTQIISTLETTTDLPDDQQSPELLTLIQTLKELIA